MTFSNEIFEKLLIIEYYLSTEFSVLGYSSTFETAVFVLYLDFFKSRLLILKD